MATLVTATCGTDVVGWSPDGASAQQRVFELQHRARVSGTGWLPKGKALAIAGSDCVVNIYSMPDKKVVANVPKATALPSNPPTITSLALSQANVLYGCSDGSINIAKLPDVQVNCLHREDGHPIADLAITSQTKLLAAASHNGNVLLVPFDHHVSKTATYLSCKDRESRCSLSCSAVGERIACASHTGGIHVWDVASAGALNFFQNGDGAVSIDYQAESQEVFFSAGASKVLALWDCRDSKKGAQIDLVKPASSIAAGMASHDVAVGDVVGVAWLYDMRRPDAPRLRLPCGPSHAVTGMQWVPRPSSLDGRSYANRTPASAVPSAACGVTCAQSNPNCASQLTVDAAIASTATQSGGVTSGLPRAPGAPRDHRRASMSAPRPIAQTLGDGGAVPVAVHQHVLDASEQGEQLGNDDALQANLSISPRSRLVGPARAEDQSGSNCRHATAMGSGLSIGGAVTGADEQVIQRVTQSSIERVMNTHVAALRTHMDDIEARILGRIMSRSSTDLPAYHTQQANDHVDRACVSIKREVQSWIHESQQETLKQFHLAQQDLMEVASALGQQISSLTASVEQLQARITADEENRRKVAQFM